MKDITGNYLNRRIRYKYIPVILLCLLLQLISTSCGNSPTHEGEVQAPIDNNSASGKYYEDVVKQFETAGFKEVTTREIQDLITGWMTKDGEVESVSINGDTEFDTDTWFSQGVSVVVAYHTFPKKGQKDISDVNVNKIDTNKDSNTKKTTATTETKTEVSNKTEATTTENAVTEQETTEEDTRGTKDNPIILTSYNIKTIKEGDYISYTGTANVKSTSEGKIKVGGNDTGTNSKCGIELFLNDATNASSSYTIEAFKVDPGEYTETFYSHAPADFKECKATISGKVDRIIISEETDRLLGISLGSDSVVEYLELSYE